MQGGAIMLKKKASYIMIGYIIIVIGILGIITMYFDVPWRKIIVRYKMTSYLKDKYCDTVKFKEIMYNFDRNVYVGIASKDKEQQLEFYIWQKYNDKNILYDTYFCAVWDQEIKEDLTHILKQQYEIDAEIEVTSRCNRGNTTTGYAYTVSNKYTRENLPYWSEVEENTSMLYGITIYANIHSSYSQNNTLKIIQGAYDSNIFVDRITCSYLLEGGKTVEESFDQREILELIDAGMLK